MNQKVKSLIYIVGFILFLVIAIFGYNYLTQRYKAPNSLNATPGSTSQASETQNSDTQTPGMPSQSQPSDSDTTNPNTTEKPEDEDDRVVAPDFTVIDYDGNEVKLSDYIGTPIVLNFWASWCPPCKAEMPHFNKVSEEYPREELLFLMVDLADGNRETVEKGKKYVEDNNYTFTVLFDTKQDAAVTYGVRSIPSTLFIDKEGFIVGGVEGGIDEKTLRHGVSLIMDN